MKKKGLGILLSLALMAGMMLAMSLTAYADTDEYQLWVGGIQVTGENAANITGSNPVAASYDAASNTLTLNNYTYEGEGFADRNLAGGAAIRAWMDDDFTIDLIGQNTVNHLYGENTKRNPGAGIYAVPTLTVTGDGTLTVSDGDNEDNFNSRGIRVEKNLTIGSGAAVNASSGKGQNSYGVNVKKLTVHGKLNAAGGSAKKSYGVYTSDEITVSKDAILNADSGTATNSFGVFIYNVDEKLSIEGAMTARGNTLAMAKAAYPTPSINTAAIQYTITEDNKTAVESQNYDGSNPTPVAAGGKTSETAKYVHISSLTPVQAPAGKTLTYNGEEQTGVEAGTGYTLSGTTSAADADSYQATATLDKGFEWADGTTAARSIPWKINKAVVKVTPPAGKTFTYDGSEKAGVAAGSSYTLSGTVKAANAGSYTAKAALKTDANYAYTWTDGTTAARSITWTINKANNPLTVKAKKATVKYSKLKKKTQTLAVNKVIGFTKTGQGKMTYKLVSAKKGTKSFKKYFSINKTTGKVTIRKNTKMKKGTYNVKVKVQAAGNVNYKASAWKAVTFKIQVK